MGEKEFRAPLPEPIAGPERRASVPWPVITSWPAAGRIQIGFVAVIPSLPGFTASPNRMVFVDVPVGYSKPIRIRVFGRSAFRFNSFVAQ